MGHFPTEEELKKEVISCGVHPVRNFLLVKKGTGSLQEWFDRVFAKKRKTKNESAVSDRLLIFTWDKIIIQPIDEEGNGAELKAKPRIAPRKKVRDFDARSFETKTSITFRYEGKKYRYTLPADSLKQMDYLQGNYQRLLSNHFFGLETEAEAEETQQTKRASWFGRAFPLLAVVFFIAVFAAGHWGFKLGGLLFDLAVLFAFGAVLMTFRIDTGRRKWHEKEFVLLHIGYAMALFAVFLLVLGVLWRLE